MRASRPIDPLPSPGLAPHHAASQVSSRYSLTGVAYDARYIGAEPSGIGQVCLELLRGLADLMEGQRLKVLVNDHTCLPTDLRENPHLALCRAPWNPISVSNQLRLPPLLAREQVRVLHTMDSHQPLYPAGLGRIVNIHDVIPLLGGPGLVTGKKARFRPLWRLWLRQQYARCSRVVTGTQEAAARILAELGGDPGKLRIIANPVRDWPRTESPTQFRARYGLRGRVIAYVGRQEPYKNIRTLIRSLPTVIDCVADPALKLVVAGSVNPRCADAQHEAAQLGLAERVVFTGYLSDASLGALYQASDVFVFPSLLEGFGIPPLEAMRFATPVVASRQTAIPEVLGDAAYYVDSADPRSLAKGILAVLRDPPLAQRLRRAGLQRVSQFSRHAIAHQYLRLYAEVLTEQAGGVRDAEPRRVLVGAAA